MKDFIGKHKTIFLILFCFTVALVSLFVCSKNSPLYPFNDWVDENAFMTVGKSWVNGVIPYRDLYEQKGPFLYLIFALAYIINNHSFIGVFIFEIVSFTFLLYYASKIIKLYLKDKYMYYIIPLFSAIVTTSPYFVHGGSAEEFTLPFFMYMLYSLLRFYKEGKISNKCLFINGLISGLIFMIKFNLLGYHFGFMASIFLYLIYLKEIKKAFKSCLVFLSGMIIPIVGFVIYFCSVKALNDFISVYIIFNITGYGTKLGILSRLYQIKQIIWQQWSLNAIIFTLSYVGVLLCVFKSEILNKKIQKISLLFIILVGSIGIFYGCVPYTYYFLPNLIFVILGLIYIGIYFEIKNIEIGKVVLIVVLAFSITYLLRTKNLSYAKNKKEDLVQFKFAKIINKKKNSTLLNYGSLDGGFYTAADKIPNTKYFQSLNAVVPNMAEQLDKEIKNKKFDFIVVRVKKKMDARTKTLYDNYKEVKCIKSSFENTKYKYYLYEKK